MADKQNPETKVRLTWQQKMQQGLPLSNLEETKADADFNYRTRLRQEKERQEFEQAKAGQVSNEAPVVPANDGKEGK